MLTRLLYFRADVNANINFLIDVLHILRSKGVNSFVTRAIKKMMISTKEQGKNTTLFVVGEKGRSQLSRIHADVSTCTHSCKRVDTVVCLCTILIF